MGELSDMQKRHGKSRLTPWFGRERLPSLHLFTEGPEEMQATTFHDLEFLRLVRSLKKGSFRDQLKLRRLFEQ